MTTLIVLLAILILTTAAYAATPKRISPARQNVVKQLNAGLAGTPMQGTGKQLEAAGWKHRVHPAFMAAAAGLESAWGRLACNGNRWNLWGLGSCNRYWRVPYFATPGQAFDYYARFLRTRWPNARSPYDFHGYCECGTRSWGSRVSWNMDRLGFGSSVRYGL